MAGDEDRRTCYRGSTQGGVELVAGVGAGQSVLDVACGPGTLAFLAARRGAEVMAVDFCAGMIGELAARLAETPAAIEARVADGMDLPLESGAFDAAFSMFGLMFFPDRARGFAELHRVLRPGGVAAGAIGEALDVRQNTMSANLAVLARSGLVRSEREGRSIRYFADYDGIRGLLAFLMEDCCGGKPELCQPVLDEIACAC